MNTRNTGTLVTTAGFQVQGAGACNTPHLVGVKLWRAIIEIEFLRIVSNRILPRRVDIYNTIESVQCCAVASSRRFCGFKMLDTSMQTYSISNILKIYWKWKTILIDEALT